MGSEDAEDIRTRMRRALPAAMKARDQPAVTALRSALAAIDNAEAVAVPNAPPPGEGRPPGAPGATDKGGAADKGAPEARGKGGAADKGGAGAGGKGGAAAGDRGAGEVKGAGATPIAGALVGLGAGEVERRRLTAVEMEEIVRREAADRRIAARAYEDAGQSARAERLRAEADLLSSHLQ